MLFYQELQLDCKALTNSQDAAGLSASSHQILNKPVMLCCLPAQSYTACF